MSPPKSPVSNTSARRGPGRNRTSETSLRRATQRLNHLTMGSRYLSKTALFGPKTVSPRCHRFVTALFWGRKVRNGKTSSCGSAGILSGGFLPSLPACLSGQGPTMDSRYLSKPALFGAKTVSPRCHRFVTALFWGRKVRNGKASSCGSTGILIESCLPSIAFLPACLTGQGKLRSRHVAEVPKRFLTDIFGHRLMRSGRFYRTLRYFACESIYNQNTRRIATQGVAPVIPFRNVYF